MALTEHRPKIENAMRVAVEETMVSVEARAATRVRREGKAEDRTTGNLVWMMCIDRETRPVQGTPDPHLHVHVLVVNATYDQTETRWKAMKPCAIVGDAPIIQAEFQTRLARKVEALGFAIAVSGHAWEIDGVPDGVRSKFSRRTEVIDLAAIERGIVSPKVKAKLAERTREKKVKADCQETQRHAWLDRIGAAERQKIEQIAQSASAVVPVSGGAPSNGTIIDSMKVAVDSLQRSFTAWSADDLLIETMMASRTPLVANDITSALACHKDALELVDVAQGVFAARHSVESLTNAITAAKDLKLASTVLATAPLSGRGLRLSGSQTACMDAVCASPRRLLLLEGALGVARNTVIEAISDRALGSGRSILRFRRDSRGVFRSTESPHSELAGLVMRDGLVVIVEDAEMLGPQSLHDLVAKVGITDARLVFVAVPRRRKDVDRGDGLRLLASQTQMAAFTLSPSSETAAGGGQREIAVNLSGDGGVHDAVVTRVASLVKARKRFVVVADNEQDQRMLTRSIRAKLRSTGYLNPPEGCEDYPCAGDRVVFNGQSRGDTGYFPGLITNVQSCHGSTVVLDGGAEYTNNDPDFDFAWVVRSAAVKGMRFDKALVVGVVANSEFLQADPKKVTFYGLRAPSSAVHAQTESGALGRQWLKLCEQLAVAGPGPTELSGRRSYKSVLSGKSATASSTPEKDVSVKTSATYKSPRQFLRQPQDTQSQPPHKESLWPTSIPPPSR
jgi:hypothetical protein